MGSFDKALERLTVISSLLNYKKKKKAWIKFLNEIQMK